MPHLIRAALVAALLIPASVWAFDSDKWDHDPLTRDWFRSLHNERGALCCDTADGVRIEDPHWKELPEGGYVVFARERWVRISPDQVVNPPDRKMGYAILWWPQNWDEPSCFLPGPRG
jgi:hypothetical protein